MSEVTFDSIIVIIYEPRWHGFARWEIQGRKRLANFEAVSVLERGWMRRLRGTYAVQCRAENAHWTRYYQTGKASNEITRHPNQ